jgi:chemotaxis protein MotB
VRGRGLAALLVVALVAPGCLVRQSTYEAEVARGESLGRELEARETRIGELERRNRDLQKSGEMLELERKALDRERLGLLEELEGMRTGNEDLRIALEQEKLVREKRETQIASLHGSYEELVEALEAELSAGQIEIDNLRGRLQVRALEKILFATGSAQVKPEGRRVLDSVAQAISRLPGEIRVEGHTDPVPISSERFPSNWELSVARATSVVRYLIERGVAEQRLSAAGYAYHRPIADNDSAEGRARNRRIEIVLVPEGE